MYNAPVAQLDRVTGFEPVGREFESLQARQFFFISQCLAAAHSQRCWFVQAGLRLLQEQEIEHQTKLKALRQALALSKGEQSGESAKTHEKIIAEAKADMHGQ